MNKLMFPKRGKISISSIIKYIDDPIKWIKEELYGLQLEDQRNAYMFRGSVLEAELEIINKSGKYDQNESLTRCMMNYDDKLNPHIDYFKTVNQYDLALEQRRFVKSCVLNGILKEASDAFKFVRYQVGLGIPSNYPGINLTGYADFTTDGDVIEMKTRGNVNKVDEHHCLQASFYHKVLDLNPKLLYISSNEWKVHSIKPILADSYYTQIRKASDEIIDLFLMSEDMLFKKFPRLKEELSGYN